MKRNLLFYIYPIRGSCWSWHFDRLTEYKEVFTGKRMIVIAKDERTEDIAKVREQAAALRAQIFEVTNDSKFGELNPFHEHLKYFESVNRDELLFYAHGKGVTHTWYRENVLAWANGLYKMNLACPALIDKLAIKYQAIGALRGKGSHGGGSWHFSGTFFWLRHDGLFSSPKWRERYADRYGVEGFPGRVIPFERSFCLSPEGNFGNLYLKKLPAELPDEWLRLLKKQFGV